MHGKDENQRSRDELISAPKLHVAKLGRHAISAKRRATGQETQSARSQRS